MDNKKIGKLIAKLRNEKGLTQQMLGDKVGVGFRAVSKWERGITMPDIGIINELSKILGISSDELLSGELKEPDKKADNDKVKENHKIPLKLTITISVIISIIIIFILVLTYINNKTYTYSIVSANDSEYNVRGQVTFEGHNISIMLNSLHFVDEEFSSTLIKDYEYYIYSGTELLFGYSMLENGNRIENSIQIKEFCDNFRINYIGKTQTKRTEILKNGMKAILNFTDNNNKKITTEVELSLYEANKKINEN